MHRNIKNPQEVRGVQETFSPFGRTAFHTNHGGRPVHLREESLDSLQDDWYGFMTLHHSYGKVADSGRRTQIINVNSFRIQDPDCWYGISSDYDTDDDRR